MNPFDNINSPFSESVKLDASAISEAAAYGLDPFMHAEQSVHQNLLTDESADLVGIAFDIDSDHTLLGETTVTLIVENQGGSVAENFQINFHLSEDPLIGNSDDLIVGSISADELASGERLIRSVELQLPIDVLNARAQAADAPGQATGTISEHLEYLGAVIDPTNLVTETDENNNFGLGKGIDIDEFVYFPWDVNRSGEITPSDGVFAFNRLGQSPVGEDALADFDGSGLVTASDVLALFNRLSLKINPVATSPEFRVDLGNDTGVSNSDFITSVASVEGNLADPTSVSTVRAGFEGMSEENFVDVSSMIQEAGFFSIDQTTLETIFGEELPEGQQTFQVQAEGETGEILSEFELSFLLDTLSPSSFISAPVSPISAFSDFSNTFSSFNLVYDEDVNSAAFLSTNYQLTIKGGINDGQIINITSVDQINSRIVTINLEEPLPNETFELIIAPSVTDLAGNSLDERILTLSVAQVPRITQISPFSGEDMVNPEREVVIRFDTPIDSTTLDSDSLSIIANGESVPGRILVSQDGQSVRFFADEAWSPSTEIRIVVEGDRILNAAGLSLDADGDGTPGGILMTEFRTLPIARVPDTDVFGFVRDSVTGEPLPGVTLFLEAHHDVFAITDETGRFLLEDVPSPEFFCRN